MIGEELPANVLAKIKASMGEAHGGDPSGNNDSYHECRICGKTH